MLSVGLFTRLEAKPGKAGVFAALRHLEGPIAKALMAQAP